MYRIDSNCVKWKLTSKGQSSEEENQSKMPTIVGQSDEEEGRRKLLKTVEVITVDLHSAAMDKAHCTGTCKRLKEEVHYEINALINILRGRELDLCIEIEREYSARVQKIDLDVMADCVDKIMKRYDESKRATCRNTLVFNSDFHALRRRLKKFGQLRREDTLQNAKKMHQEFLETSKRRDPIVARAEDSPSSLSAGSPFEMGYKTASRAKNNVPMSSASPFAVDSIAEPIEPIANLAKLKETRHELYEQLEEQRRRLKLISLENEEDSKINLGELSEDLQTVRTSSTTSRKSAVSRRGKRAWPRSIGENNDDPPEVKAEREGEGKHVNNARERLSIQDINKAFNELDRKCRMHLKTERATTKFNIIHQALEVISTLENQVRERNLSPKVACLKQREDEKNEEMPEGSLSNPGMQYLMDPFPQMMPCPSRWDEDDFEIISRNESITSELSFSLPSPPKIRFKFGGKPSCFASPLQEKAVKKFSLSSGSSAKSESSGIGESESQESSLIGAVSSGSNPEMKENPSFDGQSSSECLGGSKDEGRDINPTAALRSSFMRYLEKNHASEWLAPGKSSEQSLLPAGNSCKERVVPILVQEID